MNLQKAWDEFQDRKRKSQVPIKKLKRKGEIPTVRELLNKYWSNKKV